MSKHTYRYKQFITPENLLKMTKDANGITESYFAASQLSGLNQKEQVDIKR